MFIHLLLDKIWFPPFWLLWIKLLWISMYKFSCGHVLSVFLSMYLGMESLYQRVNLCSHVWRTTKLFSNVAALFYIPTSSVQRFQFLCILTSTCYFSFFFLNCSHPSRCEVISCCCCCWVSFHVLIDHLYIFSGEMLKFFACLKNLGLFIFFFLSF